LKQKRFQNRKRVLHEKIAMDEMSCLRQIYKQYFMKKYFGYIKINLLRKKQSICYALFFSKGK